MKLAKRPDCDAERELETLLVRAAAFAGEYGSQLSNHLPMGLMAMATLGGTSEELENFYRRYAPRLEARPPVRVDFTTANWKEHLGTHQHYSDFASFFARELKRLGPEALLRRTVPELCSGIAASGLHGLIRLAFGIEHHHDGELVEGLALWSDAYLCLAGAAPARAAQAPMHVLDELRHQEKRRGRPVVARALAPAFVEVTSDPQFGKLAGSVFLDALATEEMARLARAIFASKQDFAALHLVTATHALRIVRPYVADAAVILGPYWVAFAAIYVKIGAPEFTLSPKHSLAIPEWSEIFERAVSSCDDHVMKLVYSCEREARYYDEPIYQWLAAREVGG